MDQEKDRFVDNREFSQEVVFEFQVSIVERFPLIMVANNQKKNHHQIQNRKIYLLTTKPIPIPAINREKTKT
jgi:hypothetical protein